MAENKTETMEQDTDYFEKMVDGADRLITKATKPWKWAVICLVISVAICIVGWVASSLGWVSASNRHMDTIDRLTDQIIALEQANQIAK